MSIKQAFVTEPRVITIRSWVQCDGCGAKMSEQEAHSAFGFKQGETNVPHFDLMSGWAAVTEGSYSTQTYAHSCPRCIDMGAGALLERACT